MKAQLHLHTSRYSGCAVNTPDEMMRACLAAGYDAVYVTEHDAVWPDNELDMLRHSFRELRIFPGVELTLDDHHLLVLGTNDARYLRIGDAAEVIRRARGEGHLTVLAHPFRWRGAADMLNGPELPDALEWHTPNHLPDMAVRSEDAAALLRLALINAGDVHSMDMLDTAWIETAHVLDEPGDIREIVLTGAYENRMR